MTANDNVIIPFKGRKLDKKKPVLVYRNLNRKGKVFSLLQKGLVVAYTTAICLTDCTFIVRATGRNKVIREKRKNVHAFIKGTVSGSCMGTTALRNDLPVKVSYNPYENDSFMGDTCGKKFKLKGAMAVIINKDGVKASYTN